MAYAKNKEVRIFAEPTLLAELRKVGQKGNQAENDYLTDQLAEHLDGGKVIKCNVNHKLLILTLDKTTNVEPTKDDLNPHMTIIEDKKACIKVEHKHEEPEKDNFGFSRFAGPLDEEGAEALKAFATETLGFEAAKKYACGEAGFDVYVK